MTAPLATLGDRWTAHSVDGLLALAVGAALFLLARVFEWPPEMAVVGGLSCFLLRDALPGGQSPGRKLTRSAVVHVRTGLPCCTWQSVARNVPVLVLGVVDAVFIFGQSRRRLGDHMAGTQVVKTGH